MRSNWDLRKSMVQPSLAVHGPDETSGGGHPARYTEMFLISSYASISLARIASSVLNARSDFSIAVITPVTFSVLPVARSSTALLASCCRRETSSMLFFSTSEKLAPPSDGPDERAGCRPAPAALPTFRLSRPLIIRSSARPARGRHRRRREAWINSFVDRCQDRILDAAQ